MAKDLEKYDKLITAILIIVAFVLGIGYWFAEEKSEPVYLSKIDKLMFDKDNKAPRLVLTLPDKITAKEESFSDVAVDALPPQPAEETETPDESHLLQDILARVPNINTLANKPATMQLPYVELNSALSEKKDEFILPIIDAQGRKPWIEYGLGVKTQPNFKKVAVVIVGLGFDASAVKKIASAFDSEVSMSFTPYAPKPEELIIQARTSGHETYADLLLASKDFLVEDTGPLSLYSNISTEDALQRYYKTLAKSAPVGGIVIRDGAVGGNLQVLEMLMRDAKGRGLLVVDATTSQDISKIKIDGLARRHADIVIDKDITSEQLANLFKRAENIAFNQGQVLLAVENKPFILMALYKWIGSFSPQVSYEEAKNIDISEPFALVPVSNLVVEQ